MSVTPNQSIVIRSFGELPTEYQGAIARIFGHSDCVSLGFGDGLPQTLGQGTGTVVTYELQIDNTLIDPGPVVYLICCMLTDVIDITITDIE